MMNWIKNHKILTAVIAFVALAAIGNAGGGDTADEPESEPVAQEQTETNDEPESEPTEDEQSEEPAEDEQSEAPEPEPTEEETSEEAKVASIGEPARDGKFEFTVNGVECGIESVGPELLEEKAQGQYCALNLTVTNIGDEAQGLSASNQYLLNPEGIEYSADSYASTLYGEGDSNPLFEEINPGNTVEAAVLFDVPADANLAEAELHDSAFSGGVRVSLDA